ncbi:MAG: DUF2975 domain-containing protein [Nocardioidaceae bacterium]
MHSFAGADPQDPLAPFDFIVSLLSGLVGLGLALVVVAALFGSGSVDGLSPGHICGTTQPGAVPYYYADGQPTEGIKGLSREGRPQVTELRVCNEEPGLGTRLAAPLGSVGGMLFAAGFLLLCRVVIRAARRAGLFTSAVVKRTRVLGWFLLLGSLTLSAMELVSNGVVVASVVPTVDWTVGLATYDFPVAPVVAGLAVITFARVLAATLALQAEVDATI